MNVLLLSDGGAMHCGLVICEKEHSCTMAVVAMHRNDSAESLDLCRQNNM
jgi:hypothetical protein